MRSLSLSLSLMCDCCLHFICNTHLCTEIRCYNSIFRRRYDVHSDVLLAFSSGSDLFHIHFQMCLDASGGKHAAPRVCCCFSPIGCSHYSERVEYENSFTELNSRRIALERDGRVCVCACVCHTTINKFSPNFVKREGASALPV